MEQTQKQIESLPYPIAVYCYNCHFMRGCNARTGIVKKCERCGDGEYQLDSE